MMVLSLFLWEHGDMPSTFLQLLNEVHAEEEYKASLCRRNPTKAVHVKSATTPTGTDMKDLRGELQEQR